MATLALQTTPGDADTGMAEGPAIADWTKAMGVVALARLNTTMVFHPKVLKMG